jgi:hypothetical protein
MDPYRYMQKDAWNQPPVGFIRVQDMPAWMDQNRLDKDQLTVALATLCDGIKRELETDLVIHRDHILPAPIILPVRKKDLCLSCAPCMQKPAVDACYHILVHKSYS